MTNKFNLEIVKESILKMVNDIFPERTMGASERGICTHHSVKIKVCVDTETIISIDL